MTQKSDTEFLELIRKLLEQRHQVTEQPVRPLARPVKVWKKRRSMMRRVSDV
jgi:hypothetical protein